MVLMMTYQLQIKKVRKRDLENNIHHIKQQHMLCYGLNGSINYNEITRDQQDSQNH